MTKVVAELIVSLDMKARGLKSPGFYGYLGPEFETRLKSRNAEPHRQLIGRKTYELLNGLPQEARDEGWRDMSRRDSFLFSRTLRSADWPGLEIVRDDMVGCVKELKAAGGPDLRIVGSLSLGRQLAHANLLDSVRLYVCPLVVPHTGVEPAFEGWNDAAFDLDACELLDGRVVLLDYSLTGDPPPAA